MCSQNHMSYNFSDQKKFSTWRKLWIYLAKAEKSLGLDISDEQISEMESNIENIDFGKAAAEEKLTRHDVMAHVHVFAEQCPKAAPIIHLGATSCFVGDNTDLIVLRDGFDILLPEVDKCVKNICNAHNKKQVIKTEGKTDKAFEWVSSISLDIKRMKDLRSNLRFRGVKGTTGTQASFLTLFNGDYSKVMELDKLVTAMAGFDKSLLICGQTYSRRTDVCISSSIASLCQTIKQICEQMSLFADCKESMLCKQCCTLADICISYVHVFLATSSTQWLERTLDDSACRRIGLAQTFLYADELIEKFNNITSDLQFITSILDNYDQSDKSSISNR